MLNLYALDIETDTDGDPTGREQCPPGLDPAFDQIISVAVFDTATGTAKFLRAADLDEEALLLAELDSFLLSRPAGVLTTWNGANFDLPFLARRAEEHSVPLSLRLAPAWNRPPKYAPIPGGEPNGNWASWGPHRHIDIAYAYQRNAEQNGVKWSLKPVAAMYGIDMVEVDATRMEALTADELEAYNVSDVAGTARLTQRIAHEPALFAEWLDPDITGSPQR